MDLLDPQILVVAASSTAIAGLGLRNIFAKAAIGKALKKEAPSVDAFRHKHAAPLDGASMQNAETLNVLLTKAKDAREYFTGEISKLQIRTIAEPPTNKLLTPEYSAMGAALLSGFVGIEAYNFSASYASHIKEMVKHPGQPVPLDIHVNFIDANLIEVLDKTGVSEFVMHAVKDLGDIVPHTAIEVGSSILHEAMLPGVMTAVSTVIREAFLAFDGETDWEDTLLYGVLPAIGTFGMVKVGMTAGASIDVASGGLTHGLGTLGGSLAGLGGAIFFRHKFIGNEIEQDKKRLKPHVKRIRSQTKEAFKAINSVILEEASKLSELQGACPNIHDEDELKSLFQRMANATLADLNASRATIENDYQAVTRNIPAPTWFERLMRIDKRSAVTEAYRKAANDQIAHLQRTQEWLIKALSEHPSDVGDLLVNSPYLKNGELQKFLETIPPHLRNAAVSYDQSLKVWGNSCKQHWEESQHSVAAMTDEQKSLMAELREELAGIVNPLRMRIKANCKRLGRPPDPLIYV